MIIVAGHLRVDAALRSGYLAGCGDVVRAARSVPGCIDFHLSADPLEPDRINIFEHWDSVESVEAFRGSGPSDEQHGTVKHASVSQYEICASTSLS